MFDLRTILLMIGCFYAGFLVCLILVAIVSSGKTEDAWHEGYQQAIHDIVICGKPTPKDLGWSDTPPVLDCDSDLEWARDREILEQFRQDRGEPNETN